MQFSQADEVLRSVPYTGSRKGKFLYDFIVENGIQNVLELGFAHGTSACYMAAALAETSAGAITAVDLEVSAGFKPTIEEQAEQLGLSSRVKVFREMSSYTWFLKRQIEENSNNGVCAPIYDLCFVDGPKDWTNDGAAFFFVDKLLKPGGWVLFDDYSWSYKSHEQASGVKHDRGYIFEKLSEQELRDPQIESVFNLLVRQHPNYSNFSVIDNDVAIAQKLRGDGDNVVRMKTALTPGFLVFMMGRWLRKKFR